MAKTKVYAYRLLGLDNHAYFFNENTPTSIFCQKCGRVIDYDYFPEEISPNNKLDVGFTYDGRCIVSGRFKSLIQTLTDNVTFIQVNSKKDLYVIRPQNILEWDALQKENYCELCHQYYDQVVPYPSFLEKKLGLIEDGVFRTSIGFGSGKEIDKGSIILGVKTAETIKRVAKEQKFRGLELSAVEYFERHVPVMVAHKPTSTA